MTLEELKMKKAELRNRMDIERQEGNLCIQPETFIEYQDVIRALKWAESRLLKPIVISIIVALILSIGGCNTARSTLNLGKSIGQDGAWILGKMSDNIHTEQEK